MSTPDDGLTNWMRIEDWRTQRAAAVFRSPQSWNWFRQLHRRRLVEAGALILGAGSRGDMVHAGRIEEVVQQIFLEESQARVNGEPAQEAA